MGTDCSLAMLRLAIACLSVGVTLATGQIQRLDELRQGDSVLVSGDTFEPVLGWLAVSHEQDLEFLTLHTNLSRSLRLTGSHVVFTEKAGRPTTKYAADIGVGEVLYHQASGQRAAVTKISSETSTGYFAPLTASGTIVVDGFLASCYASYPHQLAHLALAPAIICPETSLLATSFFCIPMCFPGK